MPVDASNTASAAVQPQAAVLLQQVVQQATVWVATHFRGLQMLADIQQLLARLVASLPAAWQHAAASGLSLPCLMGDEQVMDVLHQAHVLLEVVQQQAEGISSQGRSRAASLQRSLQQVVAAVQQREAVQGLSFVWVESQLVTAIKEGHWVSNKIGCGRLHLTPNPSDRFAAAQPGVSSASGPPETVC
jgi:hypothetical protein